MSILLMPLSISTAPQNLSSLSTISGRARAEFLTTKFNHLNLSSTSSPSKTTTIIRLGGGPRTFPGGVSKWQWKRMQAKKAKQLLKARLARERQIYEMRKRAELKAAVSELERPWEVVEKAPTLFSVRADEQLKVLADRFQRPGGFDMWSERDGPELFKPNNGLPSARFFPKGVVHSVKPYMKIEKLDNGSDEYGSSGSDPEESCSGNDGQVKGKRGMRRRRADEKYGKVKNREMEGNSGSFLTKKFKNSLNEGNGGKVLKNKIRENNEKMNSNGSAGVGNFKRDDSRSTRLRVNESPIGMEKRKASSLVYDLSLQKNGSFEFQAE